MSMISNATDSPEPRDLARRVSVLEKEIERLKEQQKFPKGTANWWRTVAGAFDSDPLYEAIATEGRKWRQSQRRSTRGRKASKKGGTAGAHTRH